ncbi:MAG: alpha/beta hydrolase, partial [Blastocatellia bacterium]
ETFQAALHAGARDAGAAVNADFLRRFYDKVAPGIYGHFDGPRMLPLIAPRPLLVINGDSDARTPIPGVSECVDNARGLYDKANATDRLVLRVQEKTGHAVTPASRQIALEWFQKWLRPSTS